MWSKAVIAAAFLTLTVTPVFAQGCTPPAGMDIRQWYSVCAPALQQAYGNGMGQGMPFDAFVQSMYGVYAQPVRPLVPQPGPQQGFGGGCPIGAAQCFNGYVRQCQPMATGGSWWVTGRQRCQ